MMGYFGHNRELSFERISHPDRSDTPAKVCRTCRNVKCVRQVRQVRHTITPSKAPSSHLTRFKVNDKAYAQQLAEAIAEHQVVAGLIIVGSYW